MKEVTVNVLLEEYDRLRDIEEEFKGKEGFRTLAYYNYRDWSHVMLYSESIAIRDMSAELNSAHSELDSARNEIDSLKRRISTKKDIIEKLKEELEEQKLIKKCILF